MTKQMTYFQSNQLNGLVLGARSCKRGRLPLTFSNSLQSLISKARASSESVLQKRKWVTFINVFRVLCWRNLDRMEDVELPMYTMASLYANWYTPAFSGARSTCSLLKLYHLDILGIFLLLIDASPIIPYPLVKKLEDVNGTEGKTGRGSNQIGS